jgi:hypothetical protein
MRSTLLLLGVLVLGCGGQRAMDVEQPKELAGLAGSTDPELQRHYALLVAEKGTPQEIDAETAAASDAVTLVAGLDDIFTRFERESLVHEMDSLWPREGFRFSPAQWEKVREINARDAARRRRVRELLGKAGSLGHSPSHSYTADYAFLDSFTLAHRLEGFVAAESLAAGNPAATLEPIQTMLDLAAALEQGRGLTTSLAAARLRRETLQLVAAAANHPRATATLHAELADAIEQHLSNRLSISDLLRGERAAALMAYEMVRRGKTASLLGRDEYQQLVDERRLHAACRAIEKNVDRDQAFYLDAMQRLLLVADKPYHEQRPMLDSLQQQLVALADTPDDPYLARTLLLAEWNAALGPLAQDRFRSSMWFVALAESIEVRFNPWPDPLTGEAAEIVRESDLITIRWAQGAESVSVRR